ncbi:unnamed protein product [Linum trigynum]|uniref:Uncharacterized protein n=1 Tax=Linum trigynum TaxID=586398 RepID=A0AAV2DD16_9ROSI
MKLFFRQRLPSTNPFVAAATSPPSSSLQSAAVEIFVVVIVADKFAAARGRFFCVRERRKGKRRGKGERKGENNVAEN